MYSPEWLLDFILTLMPGRRVTPISTRLRGRLFKSISTGKNKVTILLLNFNLLRLEAFNVHVSDALGGRQLL